MLLSIIFSNDSSLFEVHTERGLPGTCNGLRTTLEDALLAWKLDQTFSFEVAFPLFIKRTMGAHCHVQRQEIALEVYNGRGPCADTRTL